MTKRSILLGLFLIVFSIPTLFGQTIDDAKKKFNRGATFLQKDELDSAIACFEKTVAICNEVGPEADIVRVKAETQIPGLYFKKAMGLYKEKKLDESIEAFIKTKEVAEKYNDTKNQQKAEKIIPQLYNIQGNQYYKNEAFDNALKSYEKAIEIDPGLAKAYFGKGLVFKNTEDEEAFDEAMKKAIEEGEASGDDKTVEQASKIAGNYYLNKGIQAKKTTDYQAASENLKKSISFNNDSEQAHYLLALVSNELKNYDDAIEASKKTIELVNNDKEELSKAQFQLGRAYQGKGNNQAACEAYKNVTSGPYVKSAKYQIEHGLKCN